MVLGDEPDVVSVTLLGGGLVIAVGKDSWNLLKSTRQAIPVR
jgi:hypothetical protein